MCDNATGIAFGVIHSLSIGVIRGRSIIFRLLIELLFVLLLFFFLFVIVFALVARGSLVILVITLIRLPVSEEFLLEVVDPGMLEHLN